MLGSAREALDRLSRLSGDLVEASRRGLQELVLTPQELDRLIKQAYDWARAASGAKAVALRREESSAPVVLDANADAMLSILGNLLSNAIRYTPAGGQVVIRQGVDGDEAWVEVEDTGIGMTPETQARVFEKFYRAPEARNVDAKGLGLGLSLVQQLVQAHQGRVEIRSAPGKGTTMRVYLPLTHQDPEAALDRDA